MDKDTFEKGTFDTFTLAEVKFLAQTYAANTHTGGDCFFVTWYTRFAKDYPEWRERLKKDTYAPYI